MLFTFPENAGAGSILAYRSGKAVYRQDFLNHVGALCATLSERKEKAWVLFSDDAYRFAVALTALLQTGKSVYLPHNAKAGTIGEMREHAEAFMGDPSVETIDMPALLLDDLDEHGVGDFDFKREFDSDITICTSGSTGKYKLIRKNPKQLITEIGTLQSTWGEVVKATTFLSTVSHQHIYGLLFRLLWPLSAQMPFVSSNYHYPEELAASIALYQSVTLISSPANLKALSLIEETKALSGIVKAVFSSGGPLPMEVSQTLQSVLKVDVIEVLGSSETGGVAYRVQSVSTDSATSWTPMRGVSVKTGDDRQLMIKSPHAGGEEWVAMGDTATLLEDGRFSLGDRVDSIVKVEGKRLSLAELERRLGNIGLVDKASALVVEGQRNAVGAVLVLTEVGRQYFERYGKQKLVEYMKNELLHYFDMVVLPKKWRIVDEIPVNQQGKVTHESLASLF